MSDGWTDPAEWSYALGDQRYGPLTLGQLHAAAQAGLLPPNTAVANVRTGVSQPAGLLLGGVPAMPGEAPGQRLGDDAVMRAILPVGRSVWAIVAGYLGLLGWAIVPLAPFALVAAELGRRDIAAHPHKHGMGRVWVGYVGGTIGCLAAIFLLAKA